MTKAFVGKCLTYPLSDLVRREEGGKRLLGELAQSKQDTPLVTIITVCFNSARTIEQAIRSVLSQSYTNIEYLVIDGNSTDGTLDILRKYEAEIDYYLSEPDDGLYFAMNKGLELARGDYILILNSDDWYVPACVEMLAEALTTQQVDFVSGLANYVDENGVFVRLQPASPFDAGVAFRMPLRHETMLVPSWLYNTVGPYDTGYRINADRDLTAKLFYGGYRHHLVCNPVLNFRMSGVSSVDLNGLFAERERMLAGRFDGLAVAALRDLTDLERISPARLQNIVRSYRMPHLRAAAVDYALDREAQGHKAWENIDVDSFSPAIRQRPVNRVHVSDVRSRSFAIPRPTVSVILPFYKGEETLAACIDSVLAQTLSDFELICINDQSPDGSQAIIDAYRKLDKRVQSRVNELNVGHGASRNRGIELARGRWIFHIDPDDTIPPNALQALVDAAQKYGSDIVRGAFVHEQRMAGQGSKPTRKGLPEGAVPEVNLSLAERPDLLHSTEGHWANLYRAEFAKRVFYPEDLKMGQDSIFLTHAYIQARSITRISDLVYYYQVNANSAMNVFDFRKHIDEIEWRHRSWQALAEVGLQELGAHLLCSYWNPPALEAFDKSFPNGQKRTFYRKLMLAFCEAGNSDLSKTKNPKLRSFFAERLMQLSRNAASGLKSPVTNVAAERSFRIVVLSALDSGGAGIAALRSVEGLRSIGHDARLYCLFSRVENEFVWKLPVKDAFHADSFDDHALRNRWRSQAVLTRQEQPKLRAREMMSKIGSLTDSGVLRALCEKADLVHLHWTTGMIDYDLLPKIVGNTPVVWTLHDMMPFTGGCHYSEGCEHFREACTPCPLVSDASDLPHRAHVKKSSAIAALPCLAVVTPSAWLTRLAQSSKVFNGRRVETIPNIFFAESFRPTDRLVARLRLGLPLDKKLVVFGAENVNSRRKGGDILVESIRYLKAMGEAKDVEGVFFGASNLDLGIKGHNMGHVSDEAKLSLIYAAGDVFAFPSREDNAPQTVIEAMLSGTPIVAFPVGNVPELVRHEDTGFIARYEDARHFAEGLAWALAAPESSEAILRGLRCHLAARAHNDPDTAVARHLRLYQEILDR